MSKLRSPGELVQPRGVVQHPARLDKRLDDIGERPTVQPQAQARVPGGAQAGAHTGAHTREPVGQVGRLDGNQAQPRYRDLMPKVWEEIGRLKVQFGSAHVAECIRRGTAGEPDWFYAFEGGHVVGTPFTADKRLAEWILVAVTMGSRHCCVMRPAAVKDGDGSN